MAILDIDLDRDLTEGIRRLAEHQYGDSQDASITHVAEVALEMRLLWEGRVNGGKNEIEEPVLDWQFVNKDSVQQLPGEVSSWLFGRR
jgi:hypothetical protein